MHWAGIRAFRLSGHHGEFCKLFCSQTSRELDFFTESGTRSGEQLLNMIDMCTAFSPGKEKDCAVFRSLFNVKSEKMEHLKAALDAVRKAAVGRQTSRELKELGVKDIRNKLFHDFLTLAAQDFSTLVACAKNLLIGIREVVDCISGDYCADYAEEALAEIEGDTGIVNRDLQVAMLSERELEVLIRQRQQMLEELERMQEERKVLKEKLGRKFDSFAVCLMQDLREQLIASSSPDNSTSFFLLKLAVLMRTSGNQIGMTGLHGTVYRVQYWGQALAVKIFHENVEGSTWRRELNSLTHLSHTNIVRIFYVVYDSMDDRKLSKAPVGYAMELMHQSLDDYLDCSIPDCLQIFKQIASALAFAHEQGIVHFDVKPDNILLDDTRTLAKLCDFSCAHTLHATSITARKSLLDGKLRGTLLYMAPEAFDGIMEDPAASSSDLALQAKLCDVYSFGKTMWKLIHPSGKMYPQSECAVTAEVPLVLKHLVEQCTKRLPRERPQSMSDVLKRLEDIQDSRIDVTEIRELDCDPGLKGDPEHQNFCKALMMMEKAAAALVPRITSEFISLHSELLPLVLQSKPEGEDEFVWKQSDHALKVWETSLSANHRSKEARRDENGGFFANVPDKSLLWSPSDGPHQIAKVYCSQGARHHSRIDDLDAAKLFNILQFCTRFPSEVRDAAVHCNPCRNISTHTKKSAMKLAQKECDVVFKCICKLLECLNDRPSHIALTEIRILYAEQWGMLNVEVVNRMKQENERLRTQVTFLQGAKSSGSFSLRVLEAHMLKVVPDFSSPQRFTCMVNVVTGPVEVGMNVASAAVSAGSVLTSASGLPVGFISNLSIPESEDSPKSPGTPKLIYTPRSFATARQDVLVEITVTDPREFTFPSLSEEAARFAGLVKKIEDASASSADDGRRRLSEIIAKLSHKPPRKLSNDDVEFCREACGLSVEECKLLPSNLVAASPSAGDASPAVETTSSSAKSRVSAKSKVAAAGGGGKNPESDSKLSDPTSDSGAEVVLAQHILDASSNELTWLIKDLLIKDPSCVGRRDKE